MTQSSLVEAKDNNFDPSLVQLPSTRKAAAKKLYIQTFGCQMNEYDSKKIEKLLEREYAPAAKAEEADLVIVNTCSVRDKPEQKLYSMLGTLRDIKRDKPNLRIGVAGCVAQQEGEAIIKREKSVDFVVGTHNLSLIPSLLKRRQESGESQIAISYRDEWEELPLGFSGKEQASVFISISRGCNKNCSYCIVPTTRGSEVSRSMSEILKEIRLSIHRGAKEVVLLGQTVNSWGLDLTPRKRFSELVEEIASLAGLERIRFTSPHPQEFRSDFISLLERSTKICRHLHLPLQSGSDKILRAMNRNYRVARYLKIVEDLRSKVPDIGLTTDIIVGFPGETISDFEETLAVMRECRFQNSYNFMFSPRPGTVAAELVDDISPDEKLSRVKEVIKLQEELSRVELHNWVEKTAEVMIDGVSGASMNNSQNSDFTESSFLQSNFMYGRSSQNITVNIDRSPLLQDSNLIGVIIPVTIYQATRYSLKAKVA